MQRLNHLRIAEIKLPPGGEWMDAGVAWRFVRVHGGAAYWLGADQNRPLAEGETLVIAPAAKGVVRASKLGEVVLHGFSFAPDLLCGIFSLAQRHFFETRAAGKPGDVQFLPSTHPVSRRLAAVAAHRLDTGGLFQTAEALEVVAAAFEEEMARYAPPAARGKNALHRFTQLITQMPAAEIINHSPDALARLCGCSARHFNRLFREHFGESTRARQTELRLLKARQLLAGSDAKIIHVALESGYRNLSLFNSLFKKRFGMTPSNWRRKAAKKGGILHCVLAALLPVFLFGAAATAFGGETGAVPAAGTNTVAAAPETGRAAAKKGPQTSNSDTNLPPDEAGAEVPHLVLAPPHPVGAAAPSAGIPSGETPPAAQTNKTVFEIKGYEVRGNTLLPASVIDPILQKQIGPAMTFDSIRQGLADLLMAYRDRGYVTVAVRPPPQQLTNGIVKIQVTEGRLADITVINNRYFTAKNILRELPSLRTNIFLNKLVFQQELDRANANRDRQIYPVIAPGPEPGTSALELRVKDRLPLHVRIELNNNSTPQSPELRLNLAAQYNNLWQLDHQIGVQYTMTPEVIKAGGYNLYDTNGAKHQVKLDAPYYDQPLIASYSMFYRMPLSGVNGPPAQRDYTVDSFGYDEATHRFRPPPATGASELLFYASRSFSDTGTQLQISTNTPNVLPSGGGLQIADQTTSRTLNPNEDVGVRWMKPLPDFLSIHSTVSLGVDYKNYRSTLLQDRVFQATLFVPAFGSNGPPWDPPNGFKSPPLASARLVFNSVQYLPLSVGLDASRADGTGSTVFNLNNSFQFANLLGNAREFENAAGDRKADGRYYVCTAGLTREQRIYRDWGVRLHADGQWANEPLLSNEQYSLGGAAGVRGYHDGEQYGDTGWRVQVEPHSPYVNLGMVDGTVPMLARFYAFADYGRRYHLGHGLALKPGPNSQPPPATLFGTGLGFNASIGERVDMRLQVGVALRDTPPAGPMNQPNIRFGDVRVAFGLGIQF